ncbi:MAG: DUF1565 domain-containing protein [Kiritimatiellae bacterium]|nr:DUF1565 domain-containing protein [Kiritimatiellia bacterium]
MVWRNASDLSNVASNQVHYCNIYDGDYEVINGNVKQVDPGWVHSGDDFHLRSTSTLINLGVSSNAITGQDIDGEIRPAPFLRNRDIGLDEFIDSDGDGLPDFWETQHAFSNGVDESQGNLDEDELTNIEEYEAGRDPLTIDPAIYVDGTLGNDTNGTGSLASPFKTIQRAINEARDLGGGQVNVESGVYVEANTLYSGVYVEGSGIEQTILEGTVDIEWMSGGGLKNMTIRGATGAGIHVSQSDQIELIKLRVQDYLSYNVYAYKSQVMIEDSVLSGSSAYGIYIDLSEVDIINTEISRNQRQGIYANQDNQVRVISSQIKDNSLGFSSYSGIYVRYRTDLYLENSSVIRNGSGIWVDTVSGTTGTVTITHSVIPYNKGQGIYVVGPGEHLDLNHSVVWRNADDLYNVASNQVRYCDIYDGDYKGINGNVKQVDPGWVHSGDDFHLRSTSALINLGVSSNAITGQDIDGEIRPTPFLRNRDIGLDEFIDSDGDGLPDFWEDQYAFSNGVDESQSNSDGDELTNIEEYGAGRDPLTVDPVIYVDETVGNDTTGTGSFASPFKTIQRGINEAHGLGDGRVNVAAGVYVENNTLYSGVYVEGAGMDQTIIQGDVNIQQMLAGGLKNITIQGVTGTGIYISQSDHIELVKLRVQDYLTYNVHVNKSQVIIEDSVLSGSQNRGMYIDLSQVEVVHSEVSQSRYEGIYAHRDNDLRVISSRIKDNSPNASGRAGIYAGDRTHLYVENSLVVRNREGIRVDTVNITTGTATIVHSVIANNQEEGVYVLGSGDQLNLINSIIWSNVNDLVGTLSNQVLHCNIYDGDYNGINGNISTNPLWFNPSNDNYHLTSDSLCINAATNIGGVDFDGEARPYGATSDIGFDEFIDIDGDGLPDWWEIENNLDHTIPTGDDGPSGDPDGDGLTNQQEYMLGLSGNQFDTDNDGLGDGEEGDIYFTDPLNPDTDGDRMFDGWEVTNNLLPLFSGDSWQDPDLDRIPNLYEFKHNTDPHSNLSVPVPSTVISNIANMQAIIDSVTPNFGVIKILPGIYTNADLIVQGNRLLFSEMGPEHTIIDAQGLGRGLFITGFYGTPTIVGLTVRNGSASQGGGIYIDNTDAWLIDNIIVSNTATYGGGIYSREASPLLNRCRITYNTASNG